MMDTRFMFQFNIKHKGQVNDHPSKGPAAQNQMAWRDLWTSPGH